jgi:hypothetical protein
MIVKPFRGLRPTPALAARIPSVPYDVVTTEEARALARGNRHSFLHVIRPEIDLAPDVDAHDRRVYEKGRENFRSFLDQGWLVRDERPAYYVYRLRAGDHGQTGIVGAAALQDYLEGQIKKHEHTRPDKEEDRARLIDALSALPGPSCGSPHSRRCCSASRDGSARSRRRTWPTAITARRPRLACVPRASPRKGQERPVSPAGTSSPCTFRATSCACSTTTGSCAT